jgi:hypothetical protein
VHTKYSIWFWMRIACYADLVWPRYPYDPYTDAPEKSLNRVGVLSVPLRLKAAPSRHVRPHEQEMLFGVEVERR